MVSGIYFSWVSEFEMFFTTSTNEVLKKLGGLPAKNQILIWPEPDVSHLSYPLHTIYFSSMYERMKQRVLRSKDTSIVWIVIEIFDSASFLVVLQIFMYEAATSLKSNATVAYLIHVLILYSNLDFCSISLNMNMLLRVTYTYPLDYAMKMKRLKIQ